MRTYSFHHAPLRIHGLRHLNPANQEYWRVTPELLAEMPQYERLGRQAGGGRVRFQTDAHAFTIRYTLKTEQLDPAMALPASAGMDVYTGIGLKARHVGTIAPHAYGYLNTPIEKEIHKAPEMDIVTINLPRNEALAALEIIVEDDATVSAPPEYSIPDPIIFYGSSITQGGCAPRPGTAYTSIVARWLDADYYNYGFSGGAKGEQAVARFIAEHETMSFFVYDYDHNAPTPEHLATTHRPFFETLRAAHPHVPVLMLSKPDFDGNPVVNAQRRDIIQSTYHHARENGDTNVYFLDGESLFGTMGREECTIDGCHPTGLGFMRMAEAVYGRILRIQSR